jgi:hypothetical protein
MSAGSSFTASANHPAGEFNPTSTPLSGSGLKDIPRSLTIGITFRNILISPLNFHFNTRIMQQPTE